MKNFFNLLDKLNPARKELSPRLGLPAPQSIEVVEVQDALLLRGGDKEYTPPFYENPVQAVWSKPNMMLNE
jgi:hypothetical protein